MSAKPAPTEAPRPPRLTIGTVCKLLHEEFPDISISKIRFLEDQKLITPRRTPGGYRLYSDDDVGQLREILRMQRDEFLPLRVIRQVIAQGRSTAGSGRRPRLVGGGEDALSLEQLLSDADADAGFVRELEEYQLLDGRRRGGGTPYSRTDVDIVIIIGLFTRQSSICRSISWA